MGVTPIKMPQLGESVTEGTVDKWLKQEGEFVKRDEALVEVVTDKVNAEIPSPFEGKLLKINVEAGATVPVGTEIAQIDVEGVPVATAPHAWTLQEVDISELVRYREAEKEGFQRRNGASLTYLPFVIQIVCDALEAFPHLNASWTDEGILVKSYVNMGIAVAIPDGL